jgi:hypothetical protein
MIKGLMREVTLAIQAKTGATPAVFVWLAIALFAALTAFVFLCVAAYDWLATLFGSVFAGLIVAGFFIVIAAIAAIASAIARRSAKQRAILERAARAQSGGWLLDPKLLATAMDIGRSIGWQRLVPIALFGFVAAQWAREYRKRDDEKDSD